MFAAALASLYNDYMVIDQITDDNSFTQLIYTLTTINNQMTNLLSAEKIAYIHIVNATKRPLSGL